MSGAHECEVWRLGCGGSATADTDQLAVEEPLEIRVGRRAVSVTMRTPGQDEELVAGFLFTEGVIESRAQLLRVAPCPYDAAGAVVNALLDPSCTAALRRLDRATISSSSCGVCGKRSLDSVAREMRPIASALRIEPSALFGLPHKMRASQTLFGRTGGVHAAALFDASGGLVAIREDIGRHNALDKLIGHGLLQDLLPWDDHVLMVSGRASFEIVQKSLAAGIPILAAVSAPSSLAVELADDHGQTLVGFVRKGRATVYTGDAVSGVGSRGGPGACGGGAAAQSGAPAPVVIEPAPHARP